jgi:hypothetical protein
LDAKKRRLERAAEELWLGLARFLASAWASGARYIPWFMEFMAISMEKNDDRPLGYLIGPSVKK